MPEKTNYSGGAQTPPEKPGVEGPQQPVQTKPIKKSIGKQIRDTFISNDIKDVAEYGLFKVLLPGIKDAVWDLVDRSLHMLFYGNGDSTRRKSSYIVDKTSYSSYYNGGKRYQQEPVRSLNPFDTIAFEERGAADDALASIKDHLSKYPDISVTQACNLARVKVDQNFMRASYGWRSSDVTKMSVSVLPNRAGYQLIVPEPTRIDN